jgi:tryptophanyl-tRNA synthetase
MSRSKKKTPVSGIAIADSEKSWKQKIHRLFRRKEKQAIRKEEDPPEKLEEIESIWEGPKDGKSRFDDEKYPELMRK